MDSSLDLSWHVKYKSRIMRQGLLKNCFIKCRNDDGGGGGDMSSMLEMGSKPGVVMVLSNGGAKWKSFNHIRFTIW